MRQSYCIKQECLRKAQGAFLLAHKLGLLETPSMEGFEARRQAHNRMLKKLEQENKKFYIRLYLGLFLFLSIISLRGMGSLWCGVMMGFRSI